MKKETIVLSVKDIKINELNEKVHDNENLNLIKTSIDEIGYITPIVVDENNVILAGHGRFEILKKKNKKIEVIKVYELSEVQKNKFRIYDNQSTMISGFDDELLLDSIEGIMNEDSNFDISILNIEGLVEAFKIDEIKVDLGELEFDKVSGKKEGVIILSENIESIKQLLNKKDIKFSNIKYED